MRIHPLSWFSPTRSHFFSGSPGNRATARLIAAKASVGCLDHCDLDCRRRAQEWTGLVPYLDRNLI